MKSAIGVAGCVLVSLVSAGCVSISPEVEPPAKIPRTVRYDSVAVSGMPFRGDLQSSLTEALVDYGVTQNIRPGASVRIEGVVLKSDYDSSGGQIAWNVVNSVLLMFMLGGPYVGATQASFELQVFDGDKLIETHRGNGRAYWTAVYALGHNIPEGRKQAIYRAELLALWDAVKGLAGSSEDE